MHIARSHLLPKTYSLHWLASFLNPQIVSTLSLISSIMTMQILLNFSQWIWRPTSETNIGCNCASGQACMHAHGFTVPICFVLLRAASDRQWVIVILVPNPSGRLLQLQSSQKVVLSYVCAAAVLLQHRVEPSYDVFRCHGKALLHLKRRIKQLTSKTQSMLINYTCILINSGDFAYYSKKIQTNIKPLIHAIINICDLDVTSGILGRYIDVPSRSQI
jgi:hypothetical protein